MLFFNNKQQLIECLYEYKHNIFGTILCAVEEKKTKFLLNVLRNLKY